MIIFCIICHIDWLSIIKFIYYHLSCYQVFNFQVLFYSSQVSFVARGKRWLNIKEILGILSWTDKLIEFDSNKDSKVLSFVSQKKSYLFWVHDIHMKEATSRCSGSPPLLSSISLLFLFGLIVFCCVKSFTIYIFMITSHVTCIIYFWI